MPSSTENVLSYLRVMVTAWREDKREDAELLARFAEGRDEAAFVVLVGRHGPLVWQTCRRLLGDTPDAEDAFQAVFLALARKAGRFPVESLAGWLHRVARRVALNAQVSARRRRVLEHKLGAVRRPEGGGDAGRDELYAVLEEELAGLPERLRVPLLLRYVENKSQVEVARFLGCSRWVVQRRLARGEAILRERLERRGLGVGVVSVGALLGSTVPVSAVPARLIGRTARAALQSLSFPFLESSTSAALAEGVMKAMWVTKVKLVAVLLGLTLCLAGGGVLTYQTLAGNVAESPPPAGETREEAKTSRQSGLGGQVAVRSDRLGDPLPEGALARLGTTRLRHIGMVTSMAFSPDGKTMATGGMDEDGTVRLWEVATGKEIRTVERRKGMVMSVAFSPDGKTMVTGGGTGVVRLWEAATGKKILTLRGHKVGVTSVAFAPDGKTVASGGRDQTVRLWEVATGKEIRTLRGHKVGVASVAFAPDGKTVASGGDGGRAARLWETSTGKEIRILQGNKGWVDAVASSPDGKTVVTGGMDGTVRLWEVATGKEIRTLKGPIGEISVVAFLPDGKTMVTGGGTGVVRLWETATGKEIRTMQGHEGRVYGGAFSPDGKTVITGGVDGMVRLWETITGKPIRILDTWHKEFASSVAFSLDGKTVAVGKVESGTVGLWEVATGKEIRTLKGHRGAVLSVAFAPDGKTVITGGQDETVRLWEVATGKEIRTLKGPGWVTSVAFAPDGKTVALGRRGMYETVGLWERRGMDETVGLWEVATGKERTLRGHRGEVSSVTFAPDGKTVASGHDKTVCLWEMATGKKMRTLQGNLAKVWSVAFSPDGRILAAASGDSVQLWELLSGKALPPLAGHRATVCGLTFSPDSRLLASFSADSTGLVWDLDSAPRPATKWDPDALWANLLSQDVARARRTVWTLAETPAQSVPLLRDRLRPVPADMGKRLAQLVADLDADEYKVREKACRGLEGLGPDVEPALRKDLESKPSLERRRRLEKLLAAVEAQQRKRGFSFSGEVLRGLRAVEVLEKAGTLEAREVLKTLADGAPGFRLTHEAQSALGRLNRARRL